MPRHFKTLITIQHNHHTREEKKNDEYIAYTNYNQHTKIRLFFETLRENDTQIPNMYILKYFHDTIVSYLYTDFCIKKTDHMYQ